AVDRGCRTAAAKKILQIDAGREVDTGVITAALSAARKADSIAGRRARMRPRLALACHLFCLGAIRCVSLLVPGYQREEWWREWRSELWHVRQGCTAGRGISRACE